MQRLIFTALALAPILVFGGQAPRAAQPPANADAGEAVFSSDTRLVQVPVSVTDKTGHLVKGLPQSAFQVFENGVRQTIKIFKAEDVPISLGLVIDNSGSMHDKRAAVESAALTLVRDSNKQDEVFVVNFNDDIDLDCDFTNDIKAMERGLKKIDSRGGTAMRDAIRMSIDHLQDRGRRDKKVILVVTDGNDNASKSDLADVVRLAQQDGVLVYAIGLLNQEEPREAVKARSALGRLVESTGGQVFYPNDLSEVARIADQVAYDIRNQYTIAYSPSNGAQDGTFRAIKVAVNAPGDLVARTRSGYYATRER